RNQRRRRERVGRNTHAPRRLDVSRHRTTHDIRPRHRDGTRRRDAATPRPRAEILRAHRERTRSPRRRSTSPETHGSRRRETLGHRPEPIMRSALTRLVRLFPAAFREKFGDGMIEQIESDYDRARARGISSALGFACATTADLMQSALAEHWNPTWTKMS